MKENADRARALDPTELAKQLRDSAEQMFRLRFQISMGQMDGLKKYRSLRKERARMLTVLGERESGQAVAPVHTGTKPAARKSATPKTSAPKAAAPAAAKPAAAKTARTKAGVKNVSAAAASAKKTGAVKTKTVARKAGTTNVKKG
jgi:large subunit ribosomal protein L29